MNEFIMEQIKEITRLLIEEGNYNSYKTKLLKEFGRDFPSYRLVDYKANYKENLLVHMGFQLDGEKQGYVEVKAIKQPEMWGVFYLAFRPPGPCYYYVDASEKSVYLRLLGHFDELARVLIGFGIQDVFHKIDLERGLRRGR